VTCVAADNCHPASCLPAVGSTSTPIAGCVPNPPDRAIDPTRAAVMRGLVLDEAGAPLPGVKVAANVCASWRW
jgi:hypothetical protein